MNLLGQGLTIGCKIKAIDGFPLMKFALLQGVGAELEAVVKVGDKVKVGTLLARPKANMLGANLHSSVSGEVVKIVKEELEKNQSGDVIYVKNDDKNESESAMPTLKEINIFALCQRLNDCGVIGFGGGGFPLACKLENFASEGDGSCGKKLRYVFINGASSEGYYTADVSVMIEWASKIVRAIDILKEATGCENF
ncbi:MAG: hypothetical protein ACI4TX_02930, partial [Christensenellales bacterium]